jgi:hypothetical protein
MDPYTDCRKHHHTSRSKDQLGRRMARLHHNTLDHMDSRKHIRHACYCSRNGNFPHHLVCSRHLQEVLQDTLTLGQLVDPGHVHCWCIFLIIRITKKSVILVFMHFISGLAIDCALGMPKGVSNLQSPSSKLDVFSKFSLLARLGARQGSSR